MCSERVRRFDEAASEVVTKSALLEASEVVGNGAMI